MSACGSALPCSPVHAAGNALNGTIPSVTGMPSSLVFLSLADNQLTGSMPWRWDLPDGLQVLMLQGNDLEGGCRQTPLSTNILRVQSWPVVNGRMSPRLLFMLS